MENEEVVNEVNESSEIESQAQDESVQSDEIESSESEVQDEWSPNFNYEVKGEQREFHEGLRDSVKDKEMEDYLRDLYTKADGLETYKAKLEKYEENAKGQNEQIDLLMNGYKSLKSNRDSNNIDALLGDLGVADNEEFQDAILDWAIKKAEHLTLPQEEQDRIDAEKQRMNEYSELKNEVASLRASEHDKYIQSERTRLSSIVSGQHGELSKTLKDAGIDFENEVIMHGTYQLRTTGIEPTLEDAVNAVATKYAYFNKPTVNTTEQTVQEFEAPTDQVLPRVRRSSNTAVHSKIRSIDDLKKLANRIG